MTTTQGASAELWAPVTKAGQVQVGDKLRFTIGDKAYSQRAKLILHAGTDKEEVIYDKGRNYYFITAMVLSGFSNHKNVEVLPRALAARPAAPVVPEGYVLVLKEPTNKMTAIGQGLRYASVNSIGEIYRQMLAASPQVAPQAEQVAKAELRTHMSEEQAEKWAWEQVKKDVGTKGWTAGDSCNYFGFFLWGWRYRAQYERQRATPERAAAPAELSGLKVYGMAKTEIGDPVHHVGKFVALVDVEALLATRTAEGADTKTCWCHACNKDRTFGGFPYAMTTMILCPTCGNKRCPRANDHRHACTESNEPGQPGSAYPGGTAHQASAPTGGAA